MSPVLGAFFCSLLNFPIDCKLEKNYWVRRPTIANLISIRERQFVRRTNYSVLLSLEVFISLNAQLHQTPLEEAQMSLAWIRNEEKNLPPWRLFFCIKLTALYSSNIVSIFRGAHEIRIRFFQNPTQFEQTPKTCSNSSPEICNFDQLSNVTHPKDDTFYLKCRLLWGQKVGPGVLPTLWKGSTCHCSCPKHAHSFGTNCRPSRKPFLTLLTLCWTTTMAPSGRSCCVCFALCPYVRGFFCLRDKATPNQWKGTWTDVVLLTREATKDAMTPRTCGPSQNESIPGRVRTNSQLGISRSATKKKTSGSKLWSSLLSGFWVWTLPQNHASASVNVWVALHWAKTLLSKTQTSTKKASPSVGLLRRSWILTDCKSVCRVFNCCWKP